MNNTLFVSIRSYIKIFGFLLSSESSVNTSFLYITMFQAEKMVYISLVDQE